jgi:hypothetical protein
MIERLQMPETSGVFQEEGLLDLTGTDGYCCIVRLDVPVSNPGRLLYM